MKTGLYSNIILEKLKEELFDKKDSIIFDSRNRNISGVEILECIDKSSEYLLLSGVQKGDRVIFLVRPSIEAVIYFFSLLRVGAVIVLVDPEMGQENFISRIEFSNAKFILQDKILKEIEKFQFVKPILRFLNIWFPDKLNISKTNRITIKSFENILKDNLTPSYKEEIILPVDTEMVIIFTSGTTNKPKGVVHSFNSLFNALNIISKEISISKEDFLYASQFYFMLIGLMVSAKVYIPRNKKFDPKTFFNISSKYKITSSFLLPFEGESLYKYLKSKNNRLPSSFKTILFGSAPVTKGFLERFSSVCNPSLNVYGVYGSTEVLPISIINMNDKINFKGRGDILGKPSEGIKIKILEDKEIIISGPQLFVKYLNDNENAKHFFSGDIGEIDENGNIILLGRKKDMIIRKGFNIYPTLFESVIDKIPGVLNSSMIGLYDNEIEDEKIILFIVPDINIKISKEKLKEILKSGQYSIDIYAIPDDIVFLDNMPVSGRSRKIDKTKLQKLALKIYD